MERKHLITIAGKLGSGKSSTANRIAEILGYTRASTGDFMRKIAQEKRVSLNELSAIAENDPSVDYALDNHNREIGTKENIVLDSRLGFYFIPHSFKVYLEIDPAIAAERILENAKVNPDRAREIPGGFADSASIIEAITTRLASERKRYKDLYNIDDHTDHVNFDVVIDTSTMPLEEVAQKIIEEYNRWLSNV